MLPVLLEMLLLLPLRFGVWKSCDQLMARDCCSWLSWRSLYSRSRRDANGEEKEKSIHQKPLIIIIYSLCLYVFCHERRQLNIRRNSEGKSNFQKASKLTSHSRFGDHYLHIFAFLRAALISTLYENSLKFMLAGRFYCVFQIRCTLYCHMQMPHFKARVLRSLGAINRERNNNWNIGKIKAAWIEKPEFNTSDDKYTFACEMKIYNFCTRNQGKKWLKKLMGVVRECCQNRL